MCMLSYFPPDVMPQEEHIQNGADVNPDGHGFAMVTARRTLMIYRGMNATEVIERFMDARERDRSGPALFHSRIATSGLVDVTGCHPFKVGQDNRTVVAHNGILFAPGADSLQSDTAIFADRMLPRFGSLDNRKKRQKLAKFVGKANKLVVLTVNPNRRRNAYVVNADQGHWADGSWHSNLDYQGWKPYTAKGWTAVKSAKDSAGAFTNVPQWRYEPWPCEMCGATNAVDSDTLICRVCDSCQDCHYNRLECLCWYPGSSTQTATSDEIASRVREVESTDTLAVIRSMDTDGLTTPPRAITSTPHIPS